MSDAILPCPTFDNGEFQLAITPAGDSFRVQAPSLARALGFRDAFRLMESIPDSEKGYTTACTPGGEQRIGYLTEAGFYRALGQRQPSRIKDEVIHVQVERFQSWVYSEVLPAIRRRGGYLTPEAAEQALKIGENSNHGRQDQARIADCRAEGLSGRAHRRGGTKPRGGRPQELDPCLYGGWDSPAGDRGRAWRTSECDLSNPRPRLTPCSNPACNPRRYAVTSHLQAPRLHPQPKKNAEAHRRQTIRLSDTNYSAAPLYEAAHPTAKRYAA